MRYLGIDYGAKRIGVAVSDEDGRIAFPKCVIDNDAAARGCVCDIASDEGVAAIVLGASRDYRGRENPIMEDIKAFAQGLEEESGLPIRFESEVLTSAAARRVPQSSDESRSRKSKKTTPVDASAAALILQSYLDTNSKF